MPLVQFRIKGIVADIYGIDSGAPGNRPHDDL